VLYNGQVKLVDFGVAKASQSAASSAKVQGKFSYMAPEKLKGAQGDRRSDIFSLGCVMWEALTLKRLFRGGNDTETMRQVLEATILPPSKVNGDVPPEYDAIVMRALDRNPARRHLTAKEMAVEIEELLRKRGYGAKNDRVAKYMQETFRSHIDARKKLVQEVVSHGNASAEVLDAAFSMAELAQGTPGRPSTEFSSQFIKPLLPVSPVDAIDHEGSGKTEVGRPPWETSETVVSAPPVIDDEGSETVVAPPQVGGMGGRMNELRARARAIWADPAKRPIAIAAAAGVVLFVLIVAVALGGGGSKKHQPTKVAEVGSSDVGSSAAAIGVPPPVVSDAAVAVVVPPPPVVVDAAVDDPGIVIEHHGSSAPPPVHHPVAPSGGGEAQALYKQGVQLFVKGDAKAALSTLLKSKSVNASYAPTWRVLGQVYRKLGDKGSAKNAFLRYLTLAPNASDAATVREQINQL